MEGRKRYLVKIAEKSGGPFTVELYLTAKNVAEILDGLVKVGVDFYDEESGYFNRKIPGEVEILEVIDRIQFKRGGEVIE